MLTLGGRMFREVGGGRSAAARLAVDEFQFLLACLTLTEISVDTRIRMAVQGISHASTLPTTDV